MAADPANHEAWLSERAHRYARLFERRAQREKHFWPRPLRRLASGAHRFLRQLRELVQCHWDIAVFDLAFGSLKAFAIYPALFAMGLAWTIAIAEYAPLNTQLWTAGYLLVRRRIASAWGRRRYGYTLDRLDAERDTLIGRRSRSHDSLHRLELGGRTLCVAIRRSRWARVLERLPGAAPPGDVISISELRRLVADAEFRLHADALRHNPTLYERVLLVRALATPEGRGVLNERLREAPRLTGLAAELDRGREATEALLIEQADALRRAPGTRSLARLGLRWLHGAYRREIRRETDNLRRLEYGLLAAHLDGKRRTVAQLQREHRRIRADIASWVGRAQAFVSRACRMRTEDQMRRSLLRELVFAGWFGLRARRATAVARWLGRPERNGSGVHAALYQGELAR